MHGSHRQREALRCACPHFWPRVTCAQASHGYEHDSNFLGCMRYACMVVYRRSTCTTSLWRSKPSAFTHSLMSSASCLACCGDSANVRIQTFGVHRPAKAREERACLRALHWVVLLAVYALLQGSLQHLLDFLWLEDEGLAEAGESRSQ